jgi:hypothetical protein
VTHQLDHPDGYQPEPIDELPRDQVLEILHAIRGVELELHPIDAPHCADCKHNRQTYAYNDHAYCVTCLAHRRRVAAGKFGTKIPRREHTPVIPRARIPRRKTVRHENRMVLL